ncbi:relaxosome component, NikC family protein [Pseudomonas sp. LW8]|uniref:relaxosome component, NikC family protein n=1 Tax=Pseudomonas sp. LW8 TaxID=3242677 RepID=UPI002F49D28C
MSNIEPLGGRVVVSEVLLKLTPKDLDQLPMACKTCPSAMWQITGKPDQPDKLTVRNYCQAMHTFTWDSKTREEILDCDRLYEKEDEEELEDEEDVPPFLRQQRLEQAQEQAQPVLDPAESDPDQFEDELVT